MANKFFTKSTLFILLAFLIVSCRKDAVRIKLSFESDVPQVLLGIEKLQDLSGTGEVSIVKSNPDFKIHITIDSVQLQPESFQIVSIRPCTSDNVQQI